MPASPHLPILVLIVASIQRIVQRRKALLHGLGLPTLLLAGLTLLVPVAGPTPGSNAGAAGALAAPSPLSALVTAVTGAGLSFVFAVSAYRILLLPKPALPGAFGLYWTRRELQFSAATLAVAGLSVIPCLFLSTLVMSTFDAADPTDWDMWAWTVFGLTFVPGLYLFARLGLILPGIATEQPLSIQNSWKLTQGNGWRIALIVFAPTLLLAGIASLAPWNSSQPTGPLEALALVVSHQLSTLMGVATLSVVYHQVRTSKSQ